jgi:hypothetical protein
MLIKMTALPSVMDPQHFDADPDSTYHPNADPDADPDSDFLFDADAETDPDPKHWPYFYLSMARAI